MPSYPRLNPDLAPDIYRKKLEQNEMPTREAVVFDMDNPRSVLRLASAAIREAILSLPTEYLNLSEKEYMIKYHPSAQENQLRVSFWREYDVAQETMRPMDAHRIYAGLCTNEFFYSCFLKRPLVVGWLIIPPVDYTTVVEESLNYGIGRIREILELPLKDARGNINSRVCELIIKATAMLDMRMRGMYVQRSEVKQLNFNMETDSKEIGKLLQGASMDEINRRIKYLEKKERKRIEKEEGSIATLSQSDVEQSEVEVLPPEAGLAPEEPK